MLNQMQTNPFYQLLNSQRLEHCSVGPSSLCLFPCLAKFPFPSHFGVFLWFPLCVQLCKQRYATVGIRWGWIVPTERNLSCNSVRFSRGKFLNRSSVSGQGRHPEKMLLFFWILSKLPPPLPPNPQLFLDAKNDNLSDIQNYSLSKILLK